MDLDPAVIIPAILFTVVAIYFASSLLSKKPDASSSSAGNKKPKVGYGDDVPPSRALGEQLRPEPPAPAVEDIGAAEKIQDVLVSQVKASRTKEPVVLMSFHLRLDRSLLVAEMKSFRNTLTLTSGPHNVPLYPEPVSNLEPVKPEPVQYQLKVEPVQEPDLYSSTSKEAEPVWYQRLCQNQLQYKVAAVPEPTPEPRTCAGQYQYLNLSQDQLQSPEPVSVPEPVQNRYQYRTCPRTAAVPEPIISRTCPRDQLQSQNQYQYRACPEPSAVQNQYQAETCPRTICSPKTVSVPRLSQNQLQSQNQSLWWCLNPVPEVSPAACGGTREGCGGVYRAGPWFYRDSLPTLNRSQRSHPSSNPEPARAVLSNDVAAAEDKVKFTPGKKQSKFETLMTKEEIEEEQRVQQEQLAAIFLLLRENQEALGEVTEGDMEEQLKLYSL
ncbi:protein TsetseEP-like isoform X1 [Lates japonicus]|uniref:Protein TsetseEP-like isoform X1 n=1 Tax=Lates japonicus TaxID=270547 RepID=A0AAD3RF89_LATJO|nr:protein TsetseEP-like isoform X1 [Lates japonicus]